MYIKNQKTLTNQPTYQNNPKNTKENLSKLMSLIVFFYAIFLINLETKASNFLKPMAWCFFGEEFKGMKMR